MGRDEGGGRDPDLAFAAKYGLNSGGTPPATLVLETQNVELNRSQVDVVFGRVGVAFVNFTGVLPSGLPRRGMSDMAA